MKGRWTRLAGGECNLSVLYTNIMMSDFKEKPLKDRRPDKNQILPPITYLSILR